MKLWTIQTIEWYEQFLNKGYAHGDEKYVDKDLLPAYKWLIPQMEKRLGGNPNPFSYPIWAWHTWSSNKKKKPDLRYAVHLNKGMKGVRIEIDKNDNEVLLSSFDLWHSVLNGTLAASSEKEWDDFYINIANNGYDQDSLIKIEKSWERIFDMDFNNEFMYLPNGENSIQATFWELKLNEIKKVDFFIAK